MAQNSNLSNPFSGLIGAEQENNSSKNSTNNLINSFDQKINALLENIFLITLNKNPPKDKQYIFMEEIAVNSSNKLLNLDLLSHALFERLLLQTPEDYLIPNDRRTMETENVLESRVLLYLFKSFDRNERFRNENDSIAINACRKIRESIVQNVSTAMKQPDLYEGQNLSQQWLEIFQNCDEDFESKGKFLSICVTEVLASEDEPGMDCLRPIFNGMFNEVLKKVKTASLVNLEKWILPTLIAFVSDKANPRLGDILLDFSTPKLAPDIKGADYSDSLLGQLLCLSITPKTDNGRYEYYDNPQEVVSSNLNASLWNYLKIHWDTMLTLFKGFLLLGGDTRSKMLNWIGNCLQANFRRGQIWNAHAMTPLAANFRTASDAFIIGLSAVLLRLCQPLLKPQLKVLMVDPTYTAVPEADRENKGVHMRDIEKETCLLPIEENETRITADKYNFVTECFFMAHKAIDLGYRVCIEKLIRMNREIHRLQGAYQDTVAQGNSQVAENVMQMLTSIMQKFLCLQNLIIEPYNDQLLLQFYEATSIWLSQITASTDIDNNDAAKSYAPLVINEFQLPLKNSVPKLLRTIPEFIIENIVGYLTFSRHFDTQAVETDPDAQSAIFTMILIFMGSSERIRNPHLRARLAEGLESLLPKSNNSSFRSSFKSNLFLRHPNRLEIVPNILRVFVGIEMTGQSVQFEQKFNYRRPMYTIMDYLWKLDEQKQCFKQLAIDAEENIEAVDAPLFLRFINLLINDAIFLLDESLSNLQQIRTLQAAQDAGEWNSLPANEREQNLLNLQQLGMMARFDNILGRDTINLLKLLTSEIKAIFCHASMVDRVAAMLNYFLLHLVGPKKGNFKVKDKKEYDFDPANTVLEICRIYVNLQESNAFCLAVSQDGRSYSHQLFEYAEQVLIRICGGQLIGEMNEFAAKVQRLDKLQKIEQEALADAPDEFLDPIMSTLMTDPVILPSSHVTVDRTTIARHLLSDQSDPFNRSPLTMDQVKSDDELKEKIQKWIKERLATCQINKTTISET